MINYRKKYYFYTKIKTVSKLLCGLLVTISIVSCQSVKQYNKKLATPVQPEYLKQDVDYTYKKLQELHPKLYWYITKEKLEYKFDSLKQTINQPLDAKGFFDKLAPVVADIKEGHLRLSVPEQRFTSKELTKLNEQKGLFSRMNYAVDKNRLFVLDNAEKFANIKVGTEILEIDGTPVADYLARYQRYINSDGFNNTYQKYSLARRWSTFFTIEKGILDSVKIKTSYNKTTKEFYLSRQQKTKEEKQQEKIIMTTLKNDDAMKIKDFNPITKSYNRDLQFLTKDSSVAYMKINTFSGKLARTFYKKSFNKIKETKSDYLILDIRNNLGGSLSEIQHLYSYLSLEKFKFIDDIEIENMNSLFQADYINQLPNLLKPLGILSYPFYTIGNIASVKKVDGKSYLRNNTIFTRKRPQKNNFKGKIYVLINGSSFSASAIIAAKLKNDNRAILVGEETGGANDGTVAGRFSTITLPHSKLELPIGIMLISPNITPTNTMKGVTPHHNIPVTAFDILQKKNREMDWIKQDIGKNKNLQ